VEVGRWVVEEGRWVMDVDDGKSANGIPVVFNWSWEIVFDWSSEEEDG
jgi:hypothetical protein